MKAGADWREHDLVFCNRFGSYLEPKYLLSRFHRLLRDAGLPDMRFHNLRHSAATFLLTMGVHPKVVQELLGHSGISMTLDIYSHAFPSLQEEAMNKWSGWFKGNEDKDKETS